MMKMQKEPHFGTLARKSARTIRKNAGRERLSWPLVEAFLESAWLHGYAAGLKMWQRHDREMKKLAKTTCTPRKRRV